MLANSFFFKLKSMRYPFALLCSLLCLAILLNGGGFNRSSSAALHEFSIAFVTVPSAEVATKVSDALLNAKVVACVNEIPGITSRYWWQGAIQSDTEHLLMIKTRAELEKDVISIVKANHPYEVPEVIFTSIHEGNPSYLQWLRESTTKSS